MNFITRISATLLFVLTTTVGGLSIPAGATFSIALKVAGGTPVNIVPPTIVGDGRPGTTFSVNPGTWENVEGLTPDISWYVEDDHKNFDDTFKPGFLYLNKSISARVTFGDEYNGGAQMFTAPITLASAQAIVTATAPKTVKPGKRFVVKATVTNPSGLNGTAVSVLEKGKFVGAYGDRRERTENTTTVAIKVDRLKPGTHKLVVKYWDSFQSWNGLHEYYGDTATLKVKVKRN